MSFRTVVITKRAKLSYKNHHLIVRGEEVTMIHLSEISILLIDSTQTVITTYLLSELIKAKIKIIVCDEDRNPIGEVVPYYGNHRTSKNISAQIRWDETLKKRIWTKVVFEKIVNQASLLKHLDFEKNKLLFGYSTDIQYDDSTNREGHAAKVYFNTLFGKDFKRDLKSSINSALNYGYTILLSSFNKEIVSKGYLTQLGIHHRNEFNYYNLSSDLMEPFRILVDNIVYMNKDLEFDSAYKMRLVDVLNEKVKINGKISYVSNAIKLYIGSIVEALDEDKIERVKFVDIDL